VFADEAGNFDFSSNGTEHFTVCAVTMRSLEVGHRLLDLRHELALEGMDVRTDGNHIQMFHATEDRQAVRDRVFSLIRAAPLEIDAIVIEKRKTRPDIAADEDYFYQLAWHRLFKYMAPRRARNDDDLLVVAGSLGDPSTTSAAPTPPASGARRRTRVSRWRTIAHGRFTAAPRGRTIAPMCSSSTKCVAASGPSGRRRRHITDPQSGMPRTWRWPPRIVAGK